MAYAFLYLPGYLYGALILLPLKFYTTGALQTKSQVIKKDKNYLLAFTPLAIYETIAFLLLIFLSGLFLGTLQDTINGFIAFGVPNLILMLGFFGSI